MESFRLDEKSIKSLPDSKDFKDFVTYFMVQIRLETLDTSTWYVLSHQVIDWFRKLSQDEKIKFAKKYNIEEKELIHNLSNPSKFKKYFKRLSKEANEQLISQFLLARVNQVPRRPIPHSIDDIDDGKKSKEGSQIWKAFDIYQLMAYILNIAVYKIEDDLTVKSYFPEEVRTILAEPKAVVDYLLSIETDSKLGALFNVAKAPPNVKGIVVRLDLEKFSNQREVIVKLRNLLKERAFLRSMIEEDSGAEYKVPKSIEFWFPGLKVIEAQQALHIIDFAVGQMHHVKSYHYGRFQVGHFPKNIQDAIGAFKNKQSSIPTIYKGFRETCALFEDGIIRDALSKMFDTVFVVASRELLISDRSEQYRNALKMLNDLRLIAYTTASDPVKNAEIINDFFKKVERASKKLERSYRFSLKDRAVKKQYRELLEKQRAQLKYAIQEKEKRPNYKLVKEEKAPDLFAKLLLQKPKDPKKGAKPGGEFDMLGEDGQERTFMIKRGDGLGDTLSEYLAHLEFEEARKLKDLKDQKMPQEMHKEVHTAVTHLVIQDKKGDKKFNNLEDFGNHILVASEFSDSLFATEGYKIAGFEERPLRAGSRFANELYGNLIWLNEQCKLGLELPLHDAIKVSDIDFHTGNIMLNFDINKIEDKTDRERAIRLIHDLEKSIKDFIQYNKKNHRWRSSTREYKQYQQQYWRNTRDKILKIKATGAQVFFQKIDHGYAYYKYHKPLRLDTSSVFKTEQMTVGYSTHVHHFQFRPKSQPSNHIGEFTENKDANKLLVSEIACQHILANPKEKQIADLTAALEKFFKHLNLTAASYSNNPEERKKAEIYLLKSFYKHTTGQNYRGEDTLEKLRTVIKTFLIEHRNLHIDRQQQYYRRELTKLYKQRATPLTHFQERLRQKLNQPLSPRGSVESSGITASTRQRRQPWGR